MSLLIEREPATESDDDLQVSADDVGHLTTQLEDLNDKRREMQETLEDAEAQLREVRSLVALGRATPAEDARREVLVERSTMLAGELRELQRLCRLTTRALSKAERLAAVAAARAASERAATLAARARERLPDAAAAMLEAAAAYCALWGLTEGAKPYFASRRERASGAIAPRELETLVTEMMAQLAEEFSGG